MLGSLFTWGAVERPSTLGVRDYGAVKTLGLCPPSPNCISTAEEVNDPEHYVPAWLVAAVAGLPILVLHRFPGPGCLFPGAPTPHAYGSAHPLLLSTPAYPHLSAPSSKLDEHHRTHTHNRTYNPEDGRGRKGPVSRSQAMDELAEAVTSLSPDGFTPSIVSRTQDYLYAEYQSPTFGVRVD